LPVCVSSLRWCSIAKLIKTIGEEKITLSLGTRDNWVDGKEVEKAFRENFPGIRIETTDRDHEPDPEELWPLPTPDSTHS